MNKNTLQNNYVMLPKSRLDITLDRTVRAKMASGFLNLNLKSLMRVSLTSRVDLGHASLAVYEFSSSESPAMCTPLFSIVTHTIGLKMEMSERRHNPMLSRSWVCWSMSIWTTSSTCLLYTSPSPRD